MASKLSTAQQTVILALGRGDEITQFHYYKASWYIRNGVASRDQLLNKGTVIKLTSLGFVMIINEARENKLVLTPAGQQEYERLFPAAAPTSQPQTVSPAAEAELDDVVLRDLLGPDFPIVEVYSHLPGIAFIVELDMTTLESDGRVWVYADTLAWAECDDVYPADRQPATSEPAADVLDGVEKIIDRMTSGWILKSDSDQHWWLTYPGMTALGVHTASAQSLLKSGLISFALRQGLTTKLYTLSEAGWMKSPQSPVASQPAVISDPEIVSMKRELDLIGDRADLWAEIEGLKSTMADMLTQEEAGKMLAEKDAEICRLQAELTDARELADQRTEAMKTAQRERDTETRHNGRILKAVDDFVGNLLSTRIYDTDLRDKCEMLQEAIQQPAARIIPATATRPPEPADDEYEADLTALVTGLPDEQAVYVEYEARFRQLDDHLYSADDVRRKMDDLEA